MRVVHGLRGLVADIYLDGNLALPTFQPERATDPIAIPAGDHLVEIRAAGAAATETPLLTQTVTVPAGFAGSLIAHLAADGKPTLTAYADDLSAVPAGQARVVVRHAAAAEPVAVQLNDQAGGRVAGARGRGDVGRRRRALQGRRDAARRRRHRSPRRRTSPYAEGTAKFMYLIGSQADGTLGWAAVEVTDLQTAPAMIQTGDGSSLADDAGPEPVADRRRRRRARRRGRRRRSWCGRAARPV